MARKPSKTHSADAALAIRSQLDPGSVAQRDYSGVGCPGDWVRTQEGRQPGQFLIQDSTGACFKVKVTPCSPLAFLGGVARNY